MSSGAPRGLASSPPPRAGRSPERYRAPGGDAPGARKPKAPGPGSGSNRGGSAGRPLPPGTAGAAPDTGPVPPRPSASPQPCRDDPGRRDPQQPPRARPGHRRPHAPSSPAGPGPAGPGATSPPLPSGTAGPGRGSAGGALRCGRSCGGHRSLGAPPRPRRCPWAAPAAEDLGTGPPVHRQGRRGPGSGGVAQHGAAGAACRDGGFATFVGPVEKPRSFSLSLCPPEQNVWGEGPGFTPFLPAPPSSPVPSLYPPHWKPSLSFMCRTDTKMPSFSCILYALRVTHQAQVHGESVHFKKVREGLGWGRAAAPAALGTGSAGAPSPQPPAGPGHALRACARRHADARCSSQGKKRLEVADQYRRPRMNVKTSAPAASGQQPSSGPQVPLSRAKKW